MTIDIDAAVVAIDTRGARLGPAEAMIREHALWSTALSHAGLTDVRKATIAEVMDPLAYYAAPRGCVAVATVLGKPAGFATVDYRNGARLTRCFVDGAYRRLGVGTRLLEAAIDDVRSRGQANLAMHVPRPSRRTASALVQRLGLQWPRRLRRDGEVVIDLEPRPR